MKKTLFALLAAVAVAPAAFAEEAAATAAATTAAPAATEAAATPAAPAAVAAELQDGTKIEITGDMVAVVGADGAKTPAPDGEHTLKDGTKVKTMGGKIVK